MAQSNEQSLLGHVVSGSLRDGIEIRMGNQVSVEDIKEGTYVTIHGQKKSFFGLITNVKLMTTDPNLQFSYSTTDNPFISEVISSSMTYGSLSVLPMLTLPAVLGADQTVEPAKTVPSHFSQVFQASERDVEVVFGKEDQTHFFIGNPLDMETKVCINLDELIKRSSAVFGKSGTGKTFLTRILLAGLIQSDLASSLVFDMHNEYGSTGQDRDRGRRVSGLKQIFENKVSVFTLDPENSKRRQAKYDFEVQIGYNEIEPEDIQLLRETLNLSDIAADAAYTLERVLGPKKWLQRFLEMEIDEVYEKAVAWNIHAQSARSLHNRLSRFKRIGFMKPTAIDDSVKRMLDLLGKGKHVILEFGRYGDNLTAYMLAANLLTRRIHDRYVYMKEEAEGTTKANEPRPLVICIEEAHRFLNPAVAHQTIFGNIARELRKYNVTLMIVDQRPSAIDSEVMSQIGTKVACQLDNDRDIDATLAGTSGSRELRSVLSKLDSKQQALIFGHAVPLPVLIRTREYGSDGSYADLTRPSWHTTDFGVETEEELEERLKELF
ncbi:ATP-binding protein [SAR202 cluster bacterium AC-409-J13_OGT_754m]|nr:ATP-binding protein [SAR202 cluster bacterium AC-409-J13_OGT_754m]